MILRLLQFLSLQYQIVKMKLQQKGIIQYFRIVCIVFCIPIFFFFFSIQLNVKTTRNNRKNVISCVTVGESDNEEQLPSKPLTYHQKQLQSLRSTPVIYQSVKSSNIQVCSMYCTIKCQKCLKTILHARLVYYYK